MRLFKIYLAITLLTACVSRNPNNSATSTPIDSTNVKGSAPAVYGANNPEHDEDSSRANANDTGTKANNISRTGYDSVQRGMKQ